MNENDVTIEQVMAGITAGDDAWVITLIERFGAKVRSVVCRRLREMGRLDLLRDADEVAGLTYDACFEIARRAGGWRPGGALPWVWAEAAIWVVVCRGAGHRYIELDDEWHQGPAPDTPVAAEDAWQRAVAADVRMAARDRRLRSGTSERDYHVVTEYETQQALGDPSPASTVAAQFELSPANVRQIVKRARDRVDAAEHTADPFQRCLLTTATAAA